MGKSISIGIDCGSSSCKGALYNGNNIISTSILPTGWSPRESGNKILEILLESNGYLRNDAFVTVTGYGRIGFKDADKTFTEITCHAVGANYLIPNVETVIDIGGQDTKSISLKNGKVLSFMMNDKCAAGTGRFLEMTAGRLGIELHEIDSLLQSGESCTINSMCAVFAESEIVGLLAEGVTREAILGGVVNSICQRAYALASKTGINSPVMITGGLSNMKGILSSLSEVFKTEVMSKHNAQYAGAIGAAILGQ